MEEGYKQVPKVKHNRRYYKEMKKPHRGDTYEWNVLPNEKVRATLLCPCKHYEKVGNSDPWDVLMIEVIGPRNTMRYEVFKTYHFNVTVGRKVKCDKD